MNRFAWASATTISEAAMAASVIVADAMTAPLGAASPDAASRDAAGSGDMSIVQAGGIDVLDLLKEGLLAPRTIASLREVPGLDAIVEQDGGGLRIGAMVTLARLADHAVLRQRCPALAEAVRGSASPQIRNVATLGGNLLQRPRCWYFRRRNTAA